MINSSTRLWQATELLDILEQKHCNHDCRHDATQCPIVTALRTQGLDLEFCPWCGGRQDGVKSRLESGEEKKSKLDEKPREKFIYSFEGGYVSGIQETKRGTYWTLYACGKCQAGLRLPYASFDFEDSIDCHHVNWHKIETRYNELIQGGTE